MVIVFKDPALGGQAAEKAQITSGCMAAVRCRKSHSLILCSQTVNDFIKIAVQYAVNLMQSQMDSVIGHSALTEIISSDFFRAVTGADLAPSKIRSLVVFFLLLQIIQSGAKDFQGFCPILQLGLLILT